MYSAAQTMLVIAGALTCAVSAFAQTQSITALYPTRPCVSPILREVANSTVNADVGTDAYAINPGLEPKVLYGWRRPLGYTDPLDS